VVCAARRGRAQGLLFLRLRQGGLWASDDARLSSLGSRLTGNVVGVFCERFSRFSGRLDRVSRSERAGLELVGRSRARLDRVEVSATRPPMGAESFVGPDIRRDWDGNTTGVRTSHRSRAALESLTFSRHGRSAVLAEDFSTVERPAAPSTGTRTPSWRCTERVQVAVLSLRQDGGHGALAGPSQPASRRMTPSRATPATVTSNASPATRAGRSPRMNRRPASSC